MKKRNIVRIISFLAAIIVVLFGIIILNMREKEKLIIQIENNYSKNLNDFSASLNNIALLLKKAKYITTPEPLNKISAELLTESEISKNALSQLPKSSHFESLNRFLSQVGNYAFAVSSEFYSDEKLPENYVKNITALSNVAGKIIQITDTAQIDFDNPDYWIKEIDNKIDSQVDVNITSFFEKIEDEFSDYPTLVYDGPYSEHISRKESQILSNSENITKTEAAEKANAFLNNPEDALEFSGEENGEITAFRFKNSNTDISISKSGGYTVYMRKNREIDRNIISYGQSLEKAKRFLENNGFNGFLETYYFIDEGVCVINFAFLDGETVCYTDLIKVGIALDNGETVLFESSGYLFNHKQRAFESSKYTPQEASKKISDNLKIEKTSIVLIPTEKGNEERCYEFLCNDYDTNVLIYINVLTLEQEEILILIQNDGGTLTK